MSTKVNMNQEIDEAIMTGERALFSLNRVKEYIRKVKDRGFFELFVGGVISSFTKYDKEEQLNQCMEVAKSDMKAFQSELRDVSMMEDLNEIVGRFLTFEEFFFDEFDVEMKASPKMKETGEQIDSAIIQIESVLHGLRKNLAKAS